MPAGYLTVILLVLLLVVAFRVIFSFNRDLYRVGAWNELLRETLPLAVLVLMVITLPLVQLSTAEWVPVAWALVLGGGIILANVLSMPALERRASRYFRRGEYQRAAEDFRELTEQKPLARYYAFLGAALGASGEQRGDGSTETGDTEAGDTETGDSRETEEPERLQGSKKAGSVADGVLQESIDASTRAVELDPQYGIAYYNRALVLRKAGRKSRAAKDMQRAQEADLPRRFRSAAKRYLEEK